MSPTQTTIAEPRTSKRVAPVFAVGMAIAGAFLIALSLPYSSLAVIGSWARIPQSVILAIGIGALVLSPIAAFLRPQWALAGATMLWGLVLVLAVSFRSPDRGDAELAILPKGDEIAERVWQTKYDWFVPNMQRDDWYGCRGTPNVSTRACFRDFDVVYSFNDEGFRIMPEPKTKPPRGEIVFVGCSYTLGAGVHNDETYSWIVASEAWPDYRVRNISYSGWGTNHAHRAVVRLLEKSTLPDAIFYGFIPHQLNRNYRRKSWFASLNRDFPLYDVDEDGKLTYLGLQDTKVADAPDSPETREKEIEITLGLIRDMAARCYAKGVPFIMLLLQPTDPSLVRELKAIPHLEVFDYGFVCFDAHPIDTHPQASWQRRIAHELASDERVSKVVGLPDLYRPHSVSTKGLPPAGPRFCLRSPTWNAVFEAEGDPPTLWRVKEAEVPEGKATAVVIIDRSFDFIEGDSYTIRWRDRAAKPCEIVIYVGSDEGEQGHVAHEVTKNVRTDWTDQQITFDAKDTTDQGVVTFRLGNASFPFEIKDIRVFHRGREIKPHFGRSSIF